MATNDKNLQKLYTRDFNERRRLAGLCRACGKKAVSATWCQKHHDRERNREREKRDKRRQNGLCVHCGYIKCKCVCIRKKYYNTTKPKFIKSFRDNKPKKKCCIRFQVIKSRAKDRNIAFNLTENSFQQWYDEQPRICYYCGVSECDIPFKRKITVDRLNNLRGYEIGNICLACSKCNILKSNFFTGEEWLEIADRYIKPRIKEYQKLQSHI